MSSALALSAGLLTVATGPPADAASPTGAASPAQVAAAKTATTSQIEKRRSEAVKTPKISWYSCREIARCATVKVPLDYDKPRGKKVTLALLKVPAKNQKNKIGTLFVNPGGPGGSGTEIAYVAEEFLSPSVLERFDVLGFDPRGVASSTNVRCSRSAQANQQLLDEIFAVAFPYGAEEEKAIRKANNKHAKACSTTGKPLSGAISTAQVARDMDLLRRAVGDTKLTYLGFSYGSYLGQVYANLYPDRVRAIAIDGILDGVAWAGTKKTESIPVGFRLKSAEGSSKALRQALVLCQQAGPTKCRFAAGDPVANFEKIAEQLRKTPVTVPDPETGELITVTYADFVLMSLLMLYSHTYGPEMVTDYAASLWEVLFASSVGKEAAAQQQTAMQTMIRLQKTVRSLSRSSLSGTRHGLSYDNGPDAFVSILCTDSRHSRNLAKFGELGVEADKMAPYFGRLWLWNHAACASKNWTVKDEDAYRGPFTKRTSSPVLIVGSYWDPSTNYASAVSTSKRMPNSRLLSSNSWGHVARDTSRCADDAVDSYLLTKKLPPKGKVCVGDYQPFSEELSDGAAAAQSEALGKPSIAVPPLAPRPR